MAKSVGADTRITAPNDSDEQESISECITSSFGVEQQKAASGSTSVSQEKKADAVVDTESPELSYCRPEKPKPGLMKLLQRHTGAWVRIWHHHS